MSRATAPGLDIPDPRAAEAPWGVRDMGAALLVTVTVLLVVLGGSALLLHLVGVSSGDGDDGPAVTITLLVGQVLVDLCAVAAAAFSLRKYRRSPQAWGLRRERPISPAACVAVLAASFGTLIVYGAATQALGLVANIGVRGV